LQVKDEEIARLNRELEVWRAARPRGTVSELVVVEMMMMDDG
jgi:hypothetical protein